MNQEEKDKNLRNIRKVCLESAESFLVVAERELGKGVDHVCFHLALLALEEIGKSILATVSFMKSTAGKEVENLDIQMDDHIKKIFWAMWGGRLLRKEKFTKEDIEKSRNLATTLHERRKLYLYTDTTNPVSPQERLEEGEAKMIIEFIRLRLEIEKNQELVDFDEKDIEIITWFFNATEDIEKRKNIFSNPSIEKLRELNDGKEWIKWLFKVYKDNEEEMRNLAQKELQRKKPDESEMMKPKYKMRLRIQTSSHSVRNNAFTKWNEGVDNIKIYKSDRKDVRKTTKDEIIIDINIPLGIPATGIWDYGLYMSKTLVIGLNVATLGVFWWNVQKDIEKYYEEIIDLEADPKGNTKLVVAPQRRWQVNFDEARFVLNEEKMRDVNTVLAFILNEAKILEEFLKSYALGLVLFSKTDVHLPFDSNAFGEFYKALKQAMRSLGDWDGTSDFKEAVKKQYEKIGEMKDLDKTLDIGLELEADTMHEKPHPITMTEVIAMKIYCDYYIQLKTKEYFEKKNPNKTQGV